MKNCVIYARQSFGLEDGSTSIEVQVEQCRKWARSNGVEIVGVYTDSNCSSELFPGNAEGKAACAVDRGFKAWLREQRTRGRKQYKEGLGQALDTIKECRPTYIVVYTSNRLGRSATNSNLNNFITSYLMEYNCSIVDVMSNSITDFSDRLLMAFRSMKDALDYQSLAEKRKASMESITKRKNRHEVWSNAFGVVMQDRVVKFDPVKSEVVRYIYDAFISGASYHGILKYLNSVFKPLAIGKQWYSTNVTSILSNVIYSGYSKDADGYIDRAVNIPEPLISFAAWTEAQELRQKRKNGRAIYNSCGGGKHWLPFSSLIYCSCGRKMQMFLDHGIMYRCINGDDHSMRIRVDDNFIKSVQNLFTIHVIDSRKKIESMKQISVEIDAIVAEIAKTEKEQKLLYNAIQDEDDLLMLRDRIDAGKGKLKMLKIKLAEAKSRQSMDLERLQDDIAEDWSMIMNDRLDHPTYQRLLIQTISKIIIHDDSVEIHLTDGNHFAIPRIQVDGRGRKVIPASTVYATTEVVEDLEHIIHYDVVFGEGENERVLIENDNYSVILKVK